MRLAGAAQWLLGGSLGVLIFTGTPLPDPQIGPHPHVAALARPDPAPTPRPPAIAPAPVVAPLPEADVDVSARETPDECSTDPCIDQYLWSLYQRTAKVDSVKVPEQIQVTVKKKGKTVTVAKTVMKLVDENFAWKDAAAAERAGMSLQDYVIGGMDRGFKRTLYHALRALDDAGLAPGITSAFRDDYRQSIAAGLHAASDRSYHGGSSRGGYGHGLAADLVSVKGDTRVERLSSSQDLWKWIDAHAQELGIGRPYLDRDPPHVGPIDGQEYADHRRGNVQHVALQAKKPQPESKNPQQEAKKPQLAAKQLAANKPQLPDAKKLQLVANKAELESKKPQPATKKHAGLETKQRAELEAKHHAGLDAKQRAGLEAKKPHRPAAPAGEHRPAKRARTAKA